MLTELIHTNPVFIFDNVSNITYLTLTLVDEQILNIKTI